MAIIYSTLFYDWLQISIDLGKGTTKFMCNCIHIHSNQSVSDVFMLAEAHGICATFDNLYLAFGAFSAEIEDFISNGTQLNGKTIRVVFLFVGDYKVYYSLLGMKQAT